ncbi:ABC transporter ATPase component [compost metagenome]
MAERIVELHPRGAEHFLGNYDDYLEKKQELAELAAEQANSSNAIKANSTDSQKSNLEADSSSSKTGAASFEADKQAKREERARLRRVEQLEEIIADLETEIERLEHELTDPDVYQDYTAIQERQTMIDEHKIKLTSAYEEWESLAEA